MVIEGKRSLSNSLLTTHCLLLSACCVTSCHNTPQAPSSPRSCLLNDIWEYKAVEHLPQIQTLALVCPTGKPLVVSLVRSSLRPWPEHKLLFILNISTQMDYRHVFQDWGLATARWLSQQYYDLLNTYYGHTVISEVQYNMQLLLFQSENQ